MKEDSLARSLDLNRVVAPRSEGLTRAVPAFPYLGLFLQPREMMWAFPSRSLSIFQVYFVHYHTAEIDAGLHALLTAMPLSQLHDPHPADSRQLIRKCSLTANLNSNQQCRPSVDSTHRTAGLRISGLELCSCGSCDLRHHALNPCRITCVSAITSQSHHITSCAQERLNTKDNAPGAQAEHHSENS